MTLHSTTSDEVFAIENEIDAAFEQSDLIDLPFAQAAWTLLSVAEEYHFNALVISPEPPESAGILIDCLMNALSYPLRVCYRKCAKSPLVLNRKLVANQYQAALDWLHAAEDYGHFCTIFPMYRAGEIRLRTEGHELVTSDWGRQDFSYEAYDRFTGKREVHDDDPVESIAVERELRACISREGAIYSVSFTRRLMGVLLVAMGKSLRERHTLPGQWSFSQFSLSEYRDVITCIQCMTHAWFLAREIVVSEGAPALAYSSAVWTPKRTTLISDISRITEASKHVVSNILTYLTFGEVGIRNPDIAIQPLVDLCNGQLGVSPLVLMHLNAERNLCVLLNQINEDRKIYSKLVNEKEIEARRLVQSELHNAGLRFAHGEINNTDVDLAIIDDSAKIVLCVEIKWFIEPAEVREILARSEELVKGIEQALSISSMFRSADSRLLSLLQIEPSYDLQTMVGSVNFIGPHRIQHPAVPITKLWQLVAIIRERGIAAAVAWLRARDYLPKKDIDFRITEVQIQSGRWRSRWYGIAHASPDL